jgi:hypothetical protein
MNLEESACAPHVESKKVVQVVSGVEPLAPAGSCLTMMDACARAMGGDDPGTAYAAAMLWFKGYPEPPYVAV